MRLTERDGREGERGLTALGQDNEEVIRHRRDVCTTDRERSRVTRTSGVDVVVVATAASMLVVVVVRIAATIAASDDANGDGRRVALLREQLRRTSDREAEPHPISVD